MSMRENRLRAILTMIEYGNEDSFTAPELEQIIRTATARLPIESIRRTILLSKQLLEARESAKEAGRANPA